MDEQFVNELAVALRKVGTIHTVGEEWHSYTGEIPVGGVPYCGQMVTRATYSALWKYAQEKYLVLDEANWQMYAEANGGNVPFYSSGDGSTTFRMPRIVGYVKGASSQSEAGTHLFEGLPNIDGQLPHNFRGTASYPESGTERGGAFTTTVNNTGSYGGTGTDWRSVDLEFHASDSNPIYGNSDHVTPETSVVMFGVYAFGAIVGTGELDAPTLSNGLATLESNVATLENTKLENSTPHIIETWSNGTQWYRKWSDGYIEQGGTMSTPSQATSGGGDTLTFPHAFSDTNYSFVVCGDRTNANTDKDWFIAYNSVTSTTIHVFTQYYTIKWYACGY